MKNLFFFALVELFSRTIVPYSLQKIGSFNLYLFGRKKHQTGREWFSLHYNEPYLSLFYIDVTAARPTALKTYIKKIAVSQLARIEIFECRRIPNIQ